MAADQLLQALKNRCGLRSRLGTFSTHLCELFEDFLELHIVLCQPEDVDLTMLHL